MPILQALVTRVRTRGPNPITSPTQGTPPAYSQPGAFQSTAGPTVGEDAALGLTAVWRSVDLISGTIAGMPLHVYEEVMQRRENGSEIALQTKLKTPAVAYLWLRPNAEMSAMTFWQTVIAHEVLGNAFIYVDDPENTGENLALWPIDPRRMRVGRLKDGRKIYQLDREVPMMDYKLGGEIVHVPNWSRTGLLGMSPLAMAAEALGTAVATNEYAGRFFSQDSTPRGVLWTEQEMDDDEATRMLERWEKQHSTLARTHRMAVLSSGLKFQPLAMSPSDTQLLEERRFNISEIARLFGVPSHLLNDQEKSTSWGTGIEEMNRGLDVYTLRSHIRRFETQINDCLLVRERTSRYVKWDLDAFMRGNTLTRNQAHALAYGRYKTPNEIRNEEDLPPIDGGDELLKQIQYVPVDEIAATMPGAVLQ